ncbi:MAG: hypothetical protein Q8935_12270, partial [Bacillota bacterium]|nr:hypothetical protein [Bacillota bacterium]
LGVLRVINDDLVDAQKWFDIHPHKVMEIISCVVNGELTQCRLRNQQFLRSFSKMFRFCHYPELFELLAFQYIHNLLKFNIKFVGNYKIRQSGKLLL